MPKPDCRKPNGNCTFPSDDGLPVQCVGLWVNDKHDYVSRYIKATQAVRAKYLPPLGPGGAAYVELFAGPGRARIRESGAFVRGSPFLAIDHTEAPFTKIVLAEMEPENVVALSKRTEPYLDRVRIISGDCNENIDKIAKEIPRYGLNLALVDPYGLRTLRFDTLGKLAAAGRMDLVIHFPTMVIKRSFDDPNTGEFITRFFGTDSWRQTVKKPGDVLKLVEILRSQLADFGYEQEAVRSVAILNSKKVPIYHLVFATKDKLGNKIWKSITATTPTGQTEFKY